MVLGWDDCAQRRGQRTQEGAGQGSTACRHRGHTALLTPTADEASLCWYDLCKGYTCGIQGVSAKSRSGSSQHAGLRHTATDDWLTSTPPQRGVKYRDLSFVGPQ